MFYRRAGSSPTRSVPRGVFFDDRPTDRRPGRQERHRRGSFWDFWRRRRDGGEEEEFQSWRRRWEGKEDEDQSLTSSPPPPSETIAVDISCPSSPLTLPPRTEMHSASRREEESEKSINNTLRNAKSDAGGSASASQAIRQSPHPYPSPSQSAHARAKNENPISPRQMRSLRKRRRGDGSEGRTDWQRSRMAFEAMRASSWLSLISTLTTWTGRLYSPPLFSKSFGPKHKKKTSPLGQLQL